jgi:hypothetical protein
MKFVISLILAVIALPAASETWVHVYGVSWHSTPGYRENNTGVGIEHRVSDRWSGMIGTFQNSLDRQSVMVAAKYHWIDRGAWSVRWMLGGATGYRNYAVAPVVLPEVCYRWVCALAVPAVGSETSTAAALYLRIPL